jgi:hypothetical protein
MKRTLTLKKESLTELTQGELTSVVGGTTTVVPTRGCPISLGLPVCITGAVCN